MNNGIRLFLIFALALSFAGCSSLATKQNEAISKGVYAERDAMRAGRFDLAEKFNEQVARLVPPPKQAIAVKPVKISGKQTVMLPSAFNALPVASIDSPTVTAAVASDKALASQLNAEGKALGSLAKQTDSILIQRQAIVDKQEAKRGIFSRLWSAARWIFGLGTVGIILAVICVAIFCPALLPAVFNILSLAFKGIKAALAYAVKGLDGLIVFIESKIPKPKG